MRGLHMSQFAFRLSEAKKKGVINKRRKRVLLDSADILDGKWAPRVKDAPKWRTTDEEEGEGAEEERREEK